MRWKWLQLEQFRLTEQSNQQVVDSKKVGGGVWKSNPPFDPRREESPALKAGKVTGPLSPPKMILKGLLHVGKRLRRHGVRSLVTREMFLVQRLAYASARPL